MTLHTCVPLTPARPPVVLQLRSLLIGDGGGRRFAGRGLEVGVINLIQLQTGADPGHRFYYHFAGIRSAVRDPPIFLTLQKRGSFGGDDFGIDFRKYHLDFAVISQRNTKEFQRSDPHEILGETTSLSAFFCNFI